MKHTLFLFLTVALLSSCTTIVEIEVEDGDDDTEQIDIPADILTPPTPFANPQNDDEYFFNYRLTQFAPDTEPLIEATFGSALSFEEIGFWEHNSYTSHAVGFSTNLPTISLIEYGKTSDYGQTTVPSDSYYYQHLHYIKGLEADTTYHYRILARDYRGRLISSADHTFTPRKLPGDVIRIPDDMEGEAPYTLEQDGGKYVLTQDLSVPTLAINIKASNVELDLDGHTIIYDEGPPVVLYSEWNEYAYDEKATFGIRVGTWGKLNVKVLNGTIKQGRNGGAGITGHGFNPLYLFPMGDGTYNEVAGITVDYYGNSVGGMVTSDGHIHHNVLYDRGSLIDDRHGAIRAVNTGSNPENIFAFNSLRRFRHRGVDGSGKTEHNELYSDSFDTNSFALGLGNNCQARYNKIFGMGYLPIGIGWANDIHVADNFIYIRGFAPTMRSQEYGRKSGIAGLRVTNYDQTTFENMLFEDNTIILKPEDGCTQARGIWTVNGRNDRNIVYRRNTVKVEAMPGNNLYPDAEFYSDDVNNAVAAVSVCGGLVDDNGGESRPAPLIFEDNHLIGNVNLVVIGEGYGIANSVWMYRTKLEKIEHDSESFRPVRLGFWYWNTLNNRMIDTQCVGFDEAETAPHFYGSDGKMEIRYGQMKTLLLTDENGARLANKSVTLTSPEESGHSQTFQTDAAGQATFDLLSVRHSKIGNGRREGGIRGSEERTDYRSYIFNVKGYQSYSINIEQLKEAEQIRLSPL
ncbi:MAG: hypothetical protein LBQ73_04600 [Tannerellaceae bacterium]|nr:hypothetical protein [Tannerellaceae bacterium]